MIRRSSSSSMHEWMVRAPLLALVLPFCLEERAVGEDKPAPVPRRHLFLDDQEVARIEKLARTMHQPTKKGAVIRPDRAWEEILQTRSAPAWNEKEKRFQLWLITSTPFPGVAGMTYVESKDGREWTKPILRQYKVNGSLENNFVTVDPKRDWPANAIENVVYDPDDTDPARRYKGLGDCNGREPMVSPDGIHWKLLNVPKLPSQDELNLNYDRETRTFLATLKQSVPNGRAVTLTTSKDFEHWSKPELIFHTDDEDQRHAAEVIKTRLADRTLQQPLYHDSAAYRADVYNMPIFRYEGIYLGLPAIFYQTGKGPDHNQDGFHHIQLISSRDLKTWKRLGRRQAFIGPSPVGEGVFDNAQLLPPSCPVVRGDELWFYYTGTQDRYTLKGKVSRGAICLAVLRRDGFVSLDAGKEPGSVVTRPFTLPKGDLHLNANAERGCITVQICDEKGKALDGFASSAPIRGDQLAARVAWTGDGLKALAGKKVCLRIELREAKLYSYWFK